MNHNISNLFEGLFERYLFSIFLASSIYASVSNVDSTTIDQRFDIGGHSLYLHCEGSGSPTVLFEAGGGNLGKSWTMVHDEIKKHTRSCYYDRAGLGRSDENPRGMGVRNVVIDLGRLLAAARIHGSLILVGHSRGGLHIRGFEAAHPDRVAALVFVDSAREQDKEVASEAETTEMLAFLDKQPEVAVQQMRGDLVAQGQNLDSFPSHIWDSMVKNMATVHHIRGFLNERRYQKADKETIRSVTSKRARTRTPVVMISAGHEVLRAKGLGSEIDSQWQDHEEIMNALTSNGIHVRANNSGHNIMYDRPDLIAQHILALLPEKRSTGSSCGWATCLFNWICPCFGSTRNHID